MAGTQILILLATVCFAYGEVKLITEPKPGEEYVFLQTSGAGSRPIERKEKPTENERVFETAHKLPPSVTYALNKADAGEKPIKHKKREALPGDGPAPAPAGAIKLDPLKLIEKYKTELRTSSTSTTTAKPKSTRSATRKARGGSKRTKKDVHDESVATSPRPVLTTGAAVAKIVDDDIPLVAAGSEKQRSRIQIKKGPNGQEYEYEYVYYYYDDDDDKNDTKITNSHDGPARNEVTAKPSRGRSTTAAPEAAANEVLPTSRGRSRGRQLPDEEVNEERLPSNTRFPPRSRNLNTTPLPDEEEEGRPKGRGRGKPNNDVASESDSVSDETQGTRGRTRANVRRPSLELVDNESFNTHSSGSEPPNGSGPSFPSDLPAGPVRFLGATPNEQTDFIDEAEKESPSEDASPTDSAASEDATTMMSPMDKVALDLYAILQGTQRLAGEEDVNTETDGAETTTFEVTTEELTTEATTPSTTTTTTTTTTPAPTTTTSTTPEPAFGRGRYRGRNGSKKVPQGTTTEAAQESKPKAKFERPRFGSRPRPGGRTTSAPADEEIHKEESKPVSSGSKTRSRFGGPRTRHTTAAPSETSNEDSSASSSAPARPSLRPRPTFNIRSRGRTTAAPSEDESSANADSAPSTTARSRPRVSGSSAVRPLRPGPRINLNARARPGATTPSTDAPAESSTAEEEETSKAEETEEKEAEPAPADNNPLNRLRNRARPALQVKPKAAASAPVQVRRVNPLLARRKPGAAEPTSEAPQESPSTEAPAAEEAEETDEPAPSSSSTTEEPRGLNKLLAGRRRLVHRQPGTVA